MEKLIYIYTTQHNQAMFFKQIIFIAKTINNLSFFIMKLRFTVIVYKLRMKCHKFICVKA
jgi:hypothetical protein